MLIVDNEATSRFGFWKLTKRSFHGVKVAPPFCNLEDVLASDSSYLMISSMLARGVASQ